MPPPNDAPSFPSRIKLSFDSGEYILSASLIDLLITARQNYDWPARTGAAISQSKIIALENFVYSCLTTLTPASAHKILVNVSDWAGNNANSHRQIVAASPMQQVEIKAAVSELFRTASRGIDRLCSLPGINLVIASKIYRFCCPAVGAAVDRHASYFFNSLPIHGQGFSTAFRREWANGRHKSSRLAIYTNAGFSINKNAYLTMYLPLMASIANALNIKGHHFRCAATDLMKPWTPPDVEMAAYYWWACNGAR